MKFELPSETLTFSAPSSPLAAIPVPIRGIYPTCPSPGTYTSKRSGACLPA